MKMNATYITVSIFALIGFLLYDKLKAGNVDNKNNILIDFSKLSDNEVIETRFKKKIENIVSKYGFSVPVSFCLTLIKNECPPNKLRGLNSNVIGDKSLTNPAYGFTQIRLPALTDFNNAYLENFSIDEMLTDENKNLTAGIGYLNLCYEKTVVEYPDNITYMTFKKYNGGIGIKLLTYNSSDSYANKAIENLKYFI